MKVPLSWLRDYVDLPPSVPQLVERLTLAGLEVAGVRCIGVPASGRPRTQTFSCPERSPTPAWWSR